MTDFKLPPHSDEAECALLAAMVERNSLINDLDFLHAHDFYRAENQVIFSRMQSLAFTGKPVDAVTLCEALEASDEMTLAGGLEYVADLLTQSRGPSNARSYADIIQDKSKSRQLTQIGFKITELGYSEAAADEKIDEAQTLAMSLTSEHESDPVHINAALQDLVKEIDIRFKSKESIIGMKTGFKDLDEATGGFQPGQCIIVAGRPGMGKSTFAMNVAEYVSTNGEMVVVFNLEMQTDSITRKMTSSASRIPDLVLKSGKLQDEDWGKLTMGVSKLKDKPLFIDDNPTLTSRNIMSRARKLANKAGKKLGLVIVDYLQLLNDTGEGTERITKISRALKLAAKSLECPIIVLSQLNRGLESRADKRPLMSDLRESGAIEQDADIIIMLYRDVVYNEHTKDANIAEAIIRKNREGENKTIYLSSRLDICRFDTLAYEYQKEQYQAPERKPFASLDR